MKNKAQEEYEIVMKDCKTLMYMLNKILNKKAIKEKKENINWGHVESFKHTRYQLKETLAFLWDNPSVSEEEVYKAIDAELEKAR